MIHGDKETALALTGFMVLILVSFTVQAKEFECLLQPNKLVDVSSPVSGILDDVSIERGDHVKKGQVIAILKSEVEQAAVDLARERAEFGNRKVIRNEELIQKNLISPSEKDELETELLISRMELRQAEAVLLQRTIASPINGVVVERYLSAGEFVQDDPIAKIAQLHPLNVEVIVPIDEIANLRKGMVGVVSPLSMVKGNYKAKIVIVDQVIDAASSTVGVRLELPNSDYKIPAGLKCRVSF